MEKQSTQNPGYNNDNIRHERAARIGAGAHGRAILMPAFALACLLLGACSTSLEMQVQPRVPEPVIGQLPIHMGVYYPEPLSQHVFVEDSEERGDWRIETGQAQMAMFKRILPAMCRKIRVVSNIPVSESAEIDAVLHPELESMQLALPEETHLDFYEAWVRYRMRLLHPDGRLIAEWPVTGYGKADDHGAFSSRKDKLNAAINAALRDAGGQFVLGFRDQQPVRSWLCSRATTGSSMCPDRVAALQ